MTTCRCGNAPRNCTCPRPQQLQVPVFVAVGWLTGHGEPAHLAVAIDDTEEGARSRCAATEGLAIYQRALHVPYPAPPQEQT